MARMDSMIWVPSDTSGIDRLIACHETRDPETEETIRNWSWGMSDDGEEVGFPRAAPDILARWPDLEDSRAEGFSVSLPTIDYLDHPEPGMGEKCAGAVAETLSQIRSSVHGGRILVAPCGAGKTVMGAGMVASLGRSALVLVHKDFLVGQWVKTFTEFAGLNPEQIGLIREDRMDFGPEFPVVIGMIQTVLCRAHSWPAELFRSFGTVVGDEVHRAGAAKWRMAAPLFPAKYRIGLTATDSRADGQEKVFLHHFGPVAARIKRKVQARYEVVPTGWNPSAELRSKMSPRGRFNFRWAQTLVATNIARNEMIADYLIQALDAGRRIIVLSDRLRQLDWLMKNLTAARGQVAARVVGGMTAEEVEAAGEAFPILLATYGFASEGLDIPSLDTAFLASPRGKAALEQSVGRILRGDASQQKEFLVLDFADMHVRFLARMANSRIAEARKMGWTVNA